MKKTLSVLLCVLLCMALLPMPAVAADYTDIYTNTFAGVDGSTYSEENSHSKLTIRVQDISNSRTTDGFTLASKNDNGSTATTITRKGGEVIKEIRFTVADAWGSAPIILKTNSGQTFEVPVKDGDEVVIKDFEATSLTITKEDGWVKTASISVIGGSPTKPSKKYTVTVNVDGPGTASATPTGAGKGTEITLTATPDEGCRLKEWQSEQVTVEDNKFTMPAKHVTVTAVFETIPAYPITVTSDGNGTAKAGSAEAKEGTVITLTATPNEGYHFKEWQSEQVTVEDNAFIMPDEAVTVKAIFEKDAGYTVTVTDNGHGTAKANRAEAAKGDAVTLTATPDDGYHFKGWQSKQVTVKDNKFTMPGENVTVKAVFEKAPVYAITVRPGKHGSIKIKNGAKAAQGETVTFTLCPDTGYRYQEGSLKVTRTGKDAPEAVRTGGSRDIPYHVIEKGKTFSFVMPDGDVTITAAFESLPPKTGDSSTPLLWLLMVLLSIPALLLIRGKRAKN